MWLKAPLTGMTFTAPPPHNVLEEYSRGIEEVEGGQEEALVGGSEGEMERRNFSMLLKYIKLNDFFFRGSYLASVCTDFCACVYLPFVFTVFTVHEQAGV